MNCYDGDTMKPKIVVGTVIIILALVFLIYNGMKDTSLYYLTVPELHAQGQEIVGQGVRVSGDVVPASIDWNVSAVELRFAMYEGDDTLQVFHKGLMPDQLVEAQQVVVEGQLGADGIFQATTLLTKCPSKYETKSEY